MTDTITLLQDLGFTEKEARAYRALLQHDPVSGYELAKVSGILRPNIYPVLQKLEARGVSTTSFRPPWWRLGLGCSSWPNPQRPLISATRRATPPARTGPPPGRQQHARAAYRPLAGRGARPLPRADRRRGAWSHAGHAPRRPAPRSAAAAGAASSAARSSKPLALERNYGYAADLLEHALAADQQAGDKNAVGRDLCFMGVVLWRYHHRPAQVIPLYQESISLSPAIDRTARKCEPLHADSMPKPPVVRHRAGWARVAWRRSNYPGLVLENSRYRFTTSKPSD